MDNEKNLFLRNIRNKIGYGLGWTFIAALWDLLSPILFASFLTILFLYIICHTKVVWIP